MQRRPTSRSTASTLGRMSDRGNPGTWLFAPPDEPESAPTAAEPAMALAAHRRSATLPRQLQRTASPAGLTRRHRRVVHGRPRRPRDHRRARARPATSSAAWSAIRTRPSTTLLGVPARVLDRARRGQRPGRRSAMAPRRPRSARARTSASRSPGSPGRTAARPTKPVGLVYVGRRRRGRRGRGPALPVDRRPRRRTSRRAQPRRSTLARASGSTARVAARDPHVGGDRRGPCAAPRPAGRSRRGRALHIMGVGGAAVGRCGAPCAAAGAVVTACDAGGPDPLTAAVVGRRDPHRVAARRRAHPRRGRRRRSWTAWP